MSGFRGISSRSSAVIVLGSKPGALLPDLTPDAVYTANGAAARAPIYFRNGQAPQATSITARKPIETSFVWEGLITLAPQRIFIRKKNKRAEEELRPLLNGTQFIQLSGRMQWEFQKPFFHWKLLYGELQYASGFWAKQQRLISHVKRGWCSFGASTGLYATLVAASEHPDAAIILAGIGIEPGGHFHLGSRKPHGRRAEVDAWLFPRLPESIRCRLFSTDEKLVEIGAAHAWPGSVLTDGHEITKKLFERGHRVKPIAPPQGIIPAQIGLAPPIPAASLPR